MICRLFAWVVRIDWRAPLTHGGGPMLDRELEARIRADERARVVLQADTAHGRPPERHAHRIGEYFTNGRVPS